ncbi:MAG TPA: hypothetical protein VMG12_26085 [Polyangiaceae bacterium]|nr:hypothetical protein [Polyangiaceae bacterium]
MIVHSSAARGVFRARPRPLSPRRAGLLALALVQATAAVVAAQEDDPIDIDAEPSGSSGDDASNDEGTSDDASHSEGESEAQPEAEQPDDAGPALLAWYGSLESDVGFARYDAEAEAEPDDTLEDHRGRFVVAPMLHLEVSDFFFEATGQLVGWVKNNQGLPLIAADDVWGKFGKQDVWDIQVGRFEAWRVYQKFPLRFHNLGPAFHSRAIGESTGAFDLFTLEDTGALVDPPVSNQSYYVDIYEVSHILLREEAGSVAFHYFPSQNWGAELHAKYGEQAQQNKLGARLAVIGRPIPQLQLSAAGEARTSRTGSPARAQDPNDPERYIECTDCGRVDQWGFGGGAVLSLGPVELAASGAVGHQKGFDAVDGTEDPEATYEVQSFGGYAQVTFDHTTIGGAVNNTQLLDESDNFQTHLQTAGYIFQSLARDLSLKLVVTYAKGKDDPANERNDGVPPAENSFLGARLRLKYYFNTL